MARPYLKCPAHWQKGTLDADPLTGLIERVETGATPATTRDEYWDGDIPWLTPKEIAHRSSGLFVSTTERKLTVAGLRESATRLMPVGTVMVSKRAPVGAVAVNTVPMATNQGFLNFICGSKLRPLYLAYWFLGNRPYLELVANGSTYPELYKGDLFEFEITVPELAVQDQAISFLSSLDFLTMVGTPLEQTALSAMRTQRISSQSAELEKTRRALLPAVLAGEVDLTPVSKHRSQLAVAVHANK